MIHLIPLLFVAMVSPTKAQSISPLRAVLTPQQDEATFTLSNPTARTKLIRLSWLHLSAEENGLYRSKTDTERNSTSAAPYLLLSPAFFQLSPGEVRKISVRMRKNIPLQDGQERRSHLLIESAGDESMLRHASTGLDLDITTAVSVPVIVRNDNWEESLVRIETTRLRRRSDGRLVLEAVLRRSGTYSIYGAIKAETVPAAGMATTEIARRENISLYPETDIRKVSIDLGVDTLPAGQFDVTIEGRGEYAGQIFARRIFNVEPSRKTPPAVTSYPPKASPAKSVTTQ